MQNCIEYFTYFGGALLNKDLIMWLRLFIIIIFLQIE